MYVIVLPVTDPELAYACVDSLNSELRERLLVIDNSADGMIDRRYRNEPIVRWSARHPEGNIGVAASWNEGISFADHYDADYLIILSQSIHFGARRGLDLIEQLRDQRPDVIMHAQFGWKCIVLARATWERVGLFDTVFTPAYFEDTDYLYRMHLAGLPSPRENGRTFVQTRVDAASAGDALALKRGTAQLDYGEMAARYARKWGGPQGAERWTRPYNVPDLDWTYIGDPPAHLRLSQEKR